MRTGIKHIWAVAPVIGWLLLILCSCPSCKKGEAPAPRVDTTVTPPPVTPPVVTVASFSTDTVYGNGVDLQPSYYNGGNVTLAIL